MDDLREYTRKKWDVVVVGTGIGGATIGHALAKEGKSVLFCERGRSYRGTSLSLVGDYAESFFARSEYPHTRHREILERAGRWPGAIEDLSFGKSRFFVPFIGAGTGGSSALYGMAMERFFPADFEPSAFSTEARGSNMPEEWPISYRELLPYYVAAERLYRVRGGGDPLRQGDAFDHNLPAPPLSSISREMWDFFAGKGLHPYHLPLACEYVEGCEGSQGFLCARNCKNDSARVCLFPAIDDHGAALLEGCEVLGLEASGDTIQGVRCAVGGEEISLRGALVILATGALETPRLLLNSATPEWPAGLANRSGMVGRNLMRHYIDLYPVTLREAHQAGGNVKEIAFNDLYALDGKKYGTVQSFGPMPPAPILVAGMEHDLERSPVPGLDRLFRLARPLTVPFFARLFAGKVVLASIIEDLPYTGNRVFPAPGDPSRSAIEYRISPAEAARIATFREKMADILKPYKFMLIKQAENNERIAHACGTCRFGHDPALSVLDATNLAHGLTNLYVVDSSFFPSSGGTNPALTIAANALRVADHLLKVW